MPKICSALTDECIGVVAYPDDIPRLLDTVLPYSTFQQLDDDCKIVDKAESWFCNITKIYHIGLKMWPIETSKVKILIIPPEQLYCITVNENKIYTVYYNENITIECRRIWKAIVKDNIPNYSNITKINLHGTDTEGRRPVSFTIINNDFKYDAGTIILTNFSNLFRQKDYKLEFEIITVNEQD